MASPSHRLAVLGSPIAHSRSPLLHRAAYARLGLDWDYGRIECRPEGFDALIASGGPEWLGFSVTMPLKPSAFAAAAWRDRAAEATEAVNTLRRDPEDPGRWLGWNTDVAGIVRALADAGVASVARPVILGGGATAASAVLALAELGAGEVTVLVRDPSRAGAPEAVADRLGLRLRVGTLAELDALGAEADLVVSTLPGSGAASVDASAALRARAPLFDVAYDPWPSPLATRWREAGGATVSGLDMLVHQALVQVRVFVSADAAAALPDEDAVLAAMRDAVA